LASTSKEGSRRGKFSMSIRRRCDEKYQYRAFKNCDWNENNIKPLTRNNWRASLVPAAAVIPAPRAYLKVVVVKKLVVDI